MQIFKVISALMDYPQEGVGQHKDELKNIIASDISLSDECKASMTAFLEEQCALDLLDWQSDYDALFERGHVQITRRNHFANLINLMRTVLLKTPSWMLCIHHLMKCQKQ